MRELHGAEATQTVIGTADGDVGQGPSTSSLRDRGKDGERTAAGHSKPAAELGSAEVDEELRLRVEVRDADRESPTPVEQHKSSIATRVRRVPRARNPSVMQSSPYLHPDEAVRKGKRKCGNVYTSRKRTKTHVRISEEKDGGAGSEISGVVVEKV